MSTEAHPPPRGGGAGSFDVQGAARLTYGALSALKERIAAALQRCCVGCGDAIGIWARTLQIRVGVCGILAAGVAR